MCSLMTWRRRYSRKTRRPLRCPHELHHIAAAAVAKARQARQDSSHVDSSCGTRVALVCAMLRRGGRVCGGALRRTLTTIRLFGEQPGPLAAPLAAALQSSLTPAAAEALRRDGYAVLDGVFGAALADELRAEVLALRRGGHMSPNATHLVSPAAAAPGGRPATLLLEKRGIHEAEAHALSGAAAQAAPRLVSLS